MPTLGETIYLRLQLFDGNPFMFVLAHLMDQDGIEVGVSPVALPHKEYGWYINTSVMPSTDVLSIIYKVFSDPLFSVESLYYSDSTEDFLLDKINHAPDLTGSVDNSMIDGVVDGSIVLDGTIFNDTLIPGSIDEDAVSGEIENSDIESSVNKENDLIGNLEC
jgi:hypothetical protein